MIPTAYSCLVTAGSDGLTSNEIETFRKVVKSLGLPQEKIEQILESFRLETKLLLLYRDLFEVDKLAEKDKAAREGK